MKFDTYYLHFKCVREVELEKESAELQAALMRGKVPDAAERTG
jgi:hypothetical protein